MKKYTLTVSLDLAQQLKAAGMPCVLMGHTRSFVPSYAEVLDWLMSNRRITIVIEPSFYEPYLGKVYNKDGFVKGFDGKTWHEAANAAIEKALTLI